ncbi:hypothetical protein EVAR_56809_1 [Eumeta japonica]|uniref:Uncharacterized protein n=1 Tax=Eumeta variegata TaxID=151549 RepID=A0A4C1Y4E1_EUMVA|nr:hypothetical protein EVAR_56809_1 [Eumeta japonica]
MADRKLRHFGIPVQPLCRKCVEPIKNRTNVRIDGQAAEGTPTDAFRVEIHQQYPIGSNLARNPKNTCITKTSRRTVRTEIRVPYPSRSDGRTVGATLTRKHRRWTLNYVQNAGYFLTRVELSKSPRALVNANKIKMSREEEANGPRQCVRKRPPTFAALWRPEVAITPLLRGVRRYRPILLRRVTRTRKEICVFPRLT